MSTIVGCPTDLSLHLSMLTRSTFWSTWHTPGKRALAKAAASREVPTASGPGVPTGLVVRARGGEDLAMEFIPVCYNGQFTKNAQQVRGNQVRSLRALHANLA
jgi:predicted benzoate:H+ symporter BenE